MAHRRQWGINPGSTISTRPHFAVDADRSTQNRLVETQEDMD